MPCKIVSIQGLCNVIYVFFVWRTFLVLILMVVIAWYTLLLVLKSHMRDIDMIYSCAAWGNGLKLIGQYLIPFMS